MIPMILKQMRSRMTNLSNAFSSLRKIGIKATLVIASKPKTTESELKKLSEELRKCLAKLPETKVPGLWRIGVTLDGNSIKLNDALRYPNKELWQVVSYTNELHDALNWILDQVKFKFVGSDVTYTRVIKEQADNCTLIGELHQDLANLAKRCSTIAETILAFLESRSDVTVAMLDSTKYFIRIGGHSVDPKEDENKVRYREWKKLVNMSASELKKFLATDEGKAAGLSRKEASEQGISSGQDSARAIIRMKSKPVSKWTHSDWKWCKKQINFITRMSGNGGPLFDDNGEKTRKHTSLS